MKNLEKRYLYLPLISRQNKSKDIYSLLKNLNNRSLLEEVSQFDSKMLKKSNDLHRIKVETMKELILNQRKIPEKWILEKDYQEILNEAMQDPTVLTYSIICQELHKSRRDGINYQEIINRERAKSHYIKTEENNKIQFSDNYLRRLKYEESIKNIKFDRRKNNISVLKGFNRNGSDNNLLEHYNNNNEFMLTSLENNPILK